MSARILLGTFGSFGDLHPYISLGLELQRRGHRPVVATSELYRHKVEGEGLAFHPIRPDLPPPEEAEAVLAKVMNGPSGSEHVIRRVLMPVLRDQYADLLPAVRSADLLVSHPILYPIPLLAEKLGLPWVGCALQPMLFLSALDPPVPPGAELAAWLLRIHPSLTTFLFGLVQDRARQWVEPVDQLRADLDLPPGENPVFAGQFSPLLNLALFSPVLGPPQNDWPRNTVVTGYALYDRHEPGRALPEPLGRFLEAGPPPVVFTLGSAAVVLGADFFRESLAAVRRLGTRAVFLVGRQEWSRLPADLPDTVHVCEYAPHGDLFPRASVVVHQGGAGTMGQALRCGKPMLVVPFAHDQPDHAARAVRLGVGRRLARERYRAAAVVRELQALLGSPALARRAEEVGATVRAERGAELACDALEAVLPKRSG